jgi:hypothetical protein
MSLTPDTRFISTTDEMGWACSTNGRNDEYIQNFGQKAQREETSEISGSHGVEYEIAVFWLVAPCSLPDDGGSKYLRNASKLLPDYTAQQPRRQPSSTGHMFGQIGVNGRKYIIN